MLRRTQTITLKDDEPAPEAAAPETAPAAEPAPQARQPRRQSFLDDEEVVAAAPVVERRRQDSLLAEIERNAGKGGRRIDDLRAEVQGKMASDNDRGPARPNNRFGGMLRPSRILLLIVALFAGGTAAYLAVFREAPPVAPVVATEAPVVAPPPVAAVRVLVASKSLGMGERITPESVQWQDWPEGALRPEYVTFAAQPEAIAEMSDAVVRYEIFAGEPIGTQKIVRAEQGYLSAVLEPGMRGVSVVISSESASGGFILPNDHVDVVLTRATDVGQDSETILRNVRVLAINARLGETGASGAPADPANPKAEVFSHEATATLELDPAQAEVIINSTTMGRLSLTLRSMADASESAKEAEKIANQAIRLTSKFWTN